MPETQHMQCLEVWGGNQAVDTGVVMAGLDAWAYSKPWGQDASGGDVHYVSSCASGRIVRMLVADVSGHGSKVAETAARLRHLMRRFVNHLDQGRFIAALNHEFGLLAEHGRFATAAAFTFFAPTNHLTISNAGHPPPLLWRARSRQWSAVSPDDIAAPAPARQRVTKRRWLREAKREDSAGVAPANVPLGILDATRYDALTLRLDVGDLVLCYTDGLSECRDRDGQLLGVAGLLREVKDIDTAEPAALTPDLLRRIAALHPDNLAGDDVTALIFRPNGLARGLTLRERLHGMKAMTDAAVRAISGREPFPWPDMTLPNVGGAIFNPLNRLWGRR